MLLRQIYDDTLAQAAYLIGCQRTGEAVIIDPERDVDRYIDAAAREGLRIVAIAETHIHADFLSGARELAERTGAKLYVSGEGGDDWSYRWLDSKAGGGSYSHELVRDGAVFRVGGIEFRTLHTPGHTPEHVCFLVTDRGGGATEPMGILSGDFVFVGDVGRPDLLETAAGQRGAADTSAHALFASIRRFAELPEYLQVWPAHGAGSACGKALGAVPQTTVGYERRFNPAVRAAGEERRFVDFILAGQPEPPLYFARMKRENRDGPAVLGALPRPRALTEADLGAADAARTAVIDTRPWEQFRAGHMPGALSIPLDNSFPTVAGSYIRPDEPIWLITEPAGVEWAVRALVRVGLDRIAGHAPPAALDGFRARGGRLVQTPEIDAGQARQRIEERGDFVLDVRRASEFAAGHIDGALSAAHVRLPERLAELPRNRPIIVHCRSGVRSARACALLQRAGFDATNLAGGLLAWERAGLAVSR